MIALREFDDLHRGPGVGLRIVHGIGNLLGAAVFFRTAAECECLARAEHEAGLGMIARTEIADGPFVGRVVGDLTATQPLDALRRRPRRSAVGARDLKHVVITMAAGPFDFLRGDQQLAVGKHRAACLRKPVLGRAGKERGLFDRIGRFLCAGGVVSERRGKGQNENEASRTHGRISRKMGPGEGRSS